MAQVVETNGRPGAMGPRGEEATEGGGPRGLRWVALGALAGVGWGVTARAWMRYISGDPAFTWSGTLMIIGLTTAAGLALGTAEMFRRRGVRGWRGVLAVPALAMFGGAGLVLAPSAVLGGLALSGRGGRWVRGPAALLACAPVVVLVVTEGAAAFPHSAVLSVAWYVGLCVALAVGWSTMFRQTPSALRVEGDPPVGPQPAPARARAAADRWSPPGA